MKSSSTWLNIIFWNTNHLKHTKLLLLWQYWELLQKSCPWSCSKWCFFYSNRIEWRTYTCRKLETICKQFLRRNYSSLAARNLLSFSQQEKYFFLERFMYVLWIMSCYSSTSSRKFSHQLLPRVGCVGQVWESERNARTELSLS